MTIRQLNGLELQQARYIWSQSFERGSRSLEDWDDWEAHTPDGRATFGIFTEAGLQASFLLVDEAIHYGGGVVIPICAVCGVGVLPASRGKGFANSGMRACFEQMRDRGQLISYLEPFSWEFYGRLGYAWTAPSRRYIVPACILPRSPETEHVRLAGPLDQPAIISCYAAFSAQYRGMLKRKQPLWSWWLDSSAKSFTYVYVYERDGIVEGYLRYCDGTDQETKITEFIVTTPRSRQGLLGLLRRHEMQTDRFRWDGPIDDSLWMTLSHRQLATSLYSRTMARIVEVKGALEAVSAPAGTSGSAVVRIIDETASWNQGVWRVDFDSGAVSVEPSANAPDVTLPIQAMTQAFLGSSTVRELRLAGAIEVHNDAGFVALDTLLGGSPAWCNDSF